MLRYLFIVGLALLLGGCASIQKMSDFTACAEPACKKCLGHRTVRCGVCNGRGSINCRTCNGAGRTDCRSCGGDGTRDGKRCKRCDHAGTIPCPHCSGKGVSTCQPCNATGMIACGTTEYSWVCRKCGKRFDYPAKLCPDCDVKKKEKD